MRKIISKDLMFKHKFYCYCHTHFQNAGKTNSPNGLIKHFFETHSRCVICFLNIEISECQCVADIVKSTESLCTRTLYKQHTTLCER